MIVELIEIHACDRCHKRGEVMLVDENELCPACAESYEKMKEDFWNGNGNVAGTPTEE